MIDGSRLSLADNVRLTRQVVEAAHALGVEVEAELGQVGSGTRLDDFTNRDYFTRPEQAARFIEQTATDFLAISIGNAHGHYVATPNLDFDRLAEINSCIAVPLVLHGGSDIPDDQVRQAVQLGINKLNVGTEYNRAFYCAIRKLMMGENTSQGYMYRCLRQAKTEVKEFIRHKIRTLNPQGYHM